MKTLVNALVILTIFTGSALADTCRYDTDWGILIMEIDHISGEVTGEYSYQNGHIQGHLDNISIHGQWFQDNGEGILYFKMTDWGFSGKWAFTDDTDWQGKWNGSLIDCANPETSLAPEE